MDSKTKDYVVRDETGGVFGWFDTEEECHAHAALRAADVPGKKYYTWKLTAVAVTEAEPAPPPSTTKLG